MQRFFSLLCHQESLNLEMHEIWFFNKVEYFARENERLTGIKQGGPLTPPSFTFNSLPDRRILDSFIFRAVADEKLIRLKL